MRPLMLLALFMVLGGSAFAGWGPLAVTESGITVYIDRTTIERDSYVVTLSVLHDYLLPEQLSAGSFLSFTAQQQYDCGEVRSRTLRAVVFSDHMGSGSVLYSGTGDKTWQPVTPMSISHALWQAACPEGKSTEVARLLPRSQTNLVTSRQRRKF